MSRKSYLLSYAALALLFATQAPSALAQGVAPTGWETNQLNNINQAAASGMLNSGQASQLQNREAQIQAQQAQYMSQNGGTLTSQEQHKIDGELRGVNRRMGGDVRHDAWQNNPNMAAPMMPFMSNGQNMMAPNMQPNWQNNLMQRPFNQQWPTNYQGQFPNVNPQAAQWQANNQQWQNQQNSGQYPHHHHHGQYGGGGGFGSVNGFGGGNVSGNGYSGGNNWGGHNWGGNGQ